MLYIFCRLCAPPPTTVQFVLETYAEGNPFILVETEIHDQYTRTECRFSSRCQFQVLITGQIPILSTQLTLTYHLLAPKWSGLGTGCKRWFRRKVRRKYVGARAWHDQPIDQIAPIQLPFRVSMGQSGSLVVIDNSVTVSMSAQSTRIPSQCHTSRRPKPTGVPISSGLTSLERCVIGVYIYIYQPLRLDKIWH